MLSLLFMCVLCNVQSVRLLQVWVIYESVPTQATIYYSRFATRFSSPILPAARLVSPNRSVSVVLFVFYSFSPGCKTNSTFTLYIIYFFDVYMRFRIGVRRYFFHILFFPANQIRLRHLYYVRCFYFFLHSHRSLMSAT